MAMKGEQVPVCRNSMHVVNILLVLGLCSLFTPAAAEQLVQWSADLSNLDYAALGPSQLELLSVAYASTVASKLDIQVEDVFDRQGHAGRVSLSAASASDIELSKDDASTTTAAAQKESARASTSSPAESTTATTLTSSTEFGTSTTMRWTSGTSTTSQISTSSAPETTSEVFDHQGMPPLRPLQGVAYGALPCTEHACGGKGLPSEDMVQNAYQQQWGETGRDDLGVISALGANAVRLYHSFGLGVQTDHSGFLDRAQEVSLNVMPGYHTENANDPSECPEYDCFETWKNATLAGFEHGFKKGGNWHPAVSTLVLLNEPDFFEGAPKCQPQGAWCRVRAAVSALDGVLAAEKEARVSAGRVKLTVTWSFAIKTSIDGKVTGAGLFGFQDMVAAIRDPKIAGYTPRMSHEDLQGAFDTRWVHGLNTQSPWDYVYELISRDYDQFKPTPWFIGEYGANGMSKAIIRGDLESMTQIANVEENCFLGGAFFQFQTTYWKGGAEMNFGLFSLGDSVLGQTGELCDKMNPNCKQWPVHCLSTELSWLPEASAARAEAVAEAWGGVVETGSGFCANRRLAETSAVGVTVTCEMRGPSLAEATQQLDTAFSNRLAVATRKVLGPRNEAILGDLLLTSIAATEVSGWPAGSAGSVRQTLPWWLSLLCGLVVGLVVFGKCSLCALACMRRRRRKREFHETASQDSGETQSSFTKSFAQV